MQFNTFFLPNSYFFKVQKQSITEPLQTRMVQFFKIAVPNYESILWSENGACSKSLRHKLQHRTFLTACEKGAWCIWNINVWLFQIKSFISACLFFHSLSPFTLKIICNTHSLSASVHYSKLVNLAIVKAKVAMRSVKKFTSQHDKSVCSAKSWGQYKSCINTCQSSTQTKSKHRWWICFK